MSNIKNMTSDQFAKNWRSGFQGAQAKWTAGIEAVDDSPCEKAAASASKWLQAINNAADKWANALDAISVGEWKDACTKGTGASWAGIDLDRSESKMKKFAGVFLPHLKDSLTELEQEAPLSTASPEDRMVRWLHKMQDFKYEPWA